MNGQPMQYASTDFSVKRVHLGYNEPKRNDVIEHQFGNLLLIYLVAPDGALAHFQPSDSYGVSWRIRAKVHEVRKICQ